MRASRRSRVLLGVVAAVPAAIGLVGPAPAATAAPPPPPPEPEQPPDTYCATALLSPAELAAGTRSSVGCFDTFEESLRSIGVDPAPVGSAGAAVNAVTNGSGLVAVHYELANSGGQYLSIGGSTCEGGGISFADGDFWNDRIRSTSPRACSTIKHFSESNYTGESQVTSGIGNVTGALSGRVSSVRYYGAVNG